MKFTYEFELSDMHVSLLRGWLCQFSRLKNITDEDVETFVVGHIAGSIGALIDAASGRTSPDVIRKKG